MSSLAGFPQYFRPFPPSPSHPKLGYRHRNSPPRLDPDIFLRKHRDSLVTQEINSYSSGLRTPPAEDDMSATYHQPVLAGNAYDTHVALSRHQNAILPSSHISGSVAASAVYEAVVNPYSKPHSHVRTAPQLLTTHSLRSEPGSGASRTSTRPSPTLTGTLSNASAEVTAVSGGDSTMVKHSLKLPRCISPNGGNLDEFAALMTCFFWFETMDTIQAAEHINTSRPTGPLPPLSKHTNACMAYKKWVNSILSTTQVTQNVVLLALLFVYRLKKTNPRVHGNPGSEYRLLTVALMLGNKFLDDNTYTNKTWAEVSGLSVKEIHVMEVEFLSNMRYGLLTSKEEWLEWLDKLACYHEYCERAQMEEAARQQAQLTPLHLSPLRDDRISPPLSSPTVPSAMAMLTTPSRTAAFSPTSSPHNNWEGTYHSTPVASPLATRPGLGLPLVRKRSLEGSDAVEPAPKKLSRPPSNNGTAQSMLPMASGADYPVRLPAPQLTLDINQALLPSACGPSYPPQVVVPLPPLKPGMRAMSTVYTTPTSSTWVQPDRALATCGPQTPSFAVPPHYGTPTKRHSPPSLSAFGSSPMAEVYASHTPVSNSPSVYLQQRPSPYKPVRRVNTLLNPPPSIPLSEYHLGSSQMHYQPLGRRHDLRSGIVPEFLPACSHARHVLNLHP
ncbi:hypothetical protein F4861DRAFT_365078 [Xylaria intraflava]|nr:hypothetical protein F4861DRAFT_365078 [Xylaria intraflava]